MSPGARRVWVILPMHDEAPHVAALFEEFRAWRGPAALRLMVVDDGSGDETSARVKAEQGDLAVTLIRHERNEGLGRALRRGVEACLAEGFGPEDALVFMDADDTHDPDLIPSLVGQLDRGGVNFAIASRYQREGRVVGVPWMRRFGGFGLNAWLRATLRVPGVTDYTSGFRALKGSLVLEGVRKYPGGLITERGFTAPFEVLLKLLGCGARFAEVPFRLRYDKKETPSHMRVGPTLGRYGVLWARWMLFHRLP